VLEKKRREGTGRTRTNMQSLTGTMVKRTTKRHPKIKKTWEKGGGNTLGPSPD